MPYIYFTEDQKRQANSVDLAEFLRRQGEKLIRSGPEYRLSSDHSVTVRGSQWYDHEAGEGGGPVSFLQTFRGMSYPEAMECLLGGQMGAPYPSASTRKEAPPKDFALPPKNHTMRRLYAYLLQKRLIAREVLDAFTKRGMIYESRETSRDGTKEYHNAVFVGTDEHGAARHAHKRSISDLGRTFRMNVEGGDPRCSFHWFGHSGRLYVFEAPIDLLAFLTLNPEAWQEHSYVALCGTAEHAMLWMLEKDPRLQKVVLCLDHDAAGIEAAGRLAEILQEHGFTDVITLRSACKDWDEDLKARHGLEAQPAEEHPQLTMAGEVCRRIGTMCGERNPDRAAERLPELFRGYRACLEGHKLEEAMDCAEEMAALSMAVTLRECRQMGTALTPQQGAQYLQNRVLPHQNRSGLKSRTAELSSLIQDITQRSGTPDVRSQAEKRELASAWLELALACAKAAVKYEADQWKQEQLRQENTGPALQM